MKQEQIHDALNLLDDDLIEAVDDLRDKAGLNEALFKERSNSQKKQKTPWIKYMSVAACLCVAVLGAFVWRHYEAKDSAKNKYDGVSDTDGSNKTTEGNTSNDSLTGNAPDQELDGATPDGTLEETVDGSISVVEVPSVLVRIDAWTENGFKGVVAGIVDTDIFSVGAGICVVFNENIRVTIKTEEYMKFEGGAPDKRDFPVGSVVRVQFVKHEQATEGASDTKHAGTIFAELIAMPD